MLLKERTQYTYPKTMRDRNHDRTSHLETMAHYHPQAIERKGQLKEITNRVELETLLVADAMRSVGMDGSVTFEQIDEQLVAAKACFDNWLDGAFIVSLSDSGMLHFKVTEAGKAQAKHILQRGEKS